MKIELLQMTHHTASLKYFILGFCLFIGASLSAQNLQLPTDLLEARKLLSNNEYESCLNVLRQVDATKQSEKKLLKQIKAEAFFKLKKFNEAADLFIFLAAKKAPHANLWAARCYAELNKSVSATEQLSVYLKTKKRLSPKLIQSDTSFVKIIKTKEWKKLWVKDPYKNFEYETDEAAYHHRFGRIDEAKEIVQNIIVKHRYAPAWLLYAKIEAKQGNMKSAQKAFEAAFIYDRKNTDIIKAYSSWLLKREKYRDVIRLCEKAMKHAPAEVKLYSDLAVAKYQTDDVDAAEIYADAFVQFSQENEASFFETGQMYYQMEDYLEALRFFSKCLKQKPRYEYYKARGKTYFQSNSYEYAMRDLAMAIDLRPNDAEAVFFQAEIYFLRKKKERACSSWRRASRLGYHKALLRYNKHCAD